MVALVKWSTMCVLSALLPAARALRVDSRGEDAPFVIAASDFDLERRPDVVLEQSALGSGFLGNHLQQLTNKLMFAISRGYHNVDVSHVAFTVIDLLELPRVIDISNAAKLPGGVPDKCGEKGYGGCSVPFSYRYNISQQFLKPYVKCAPREERFQGLTLYLRHLEDPGQFYRQPPCAMYKDVLQRSKFNHVEIIAAGSVPRGNPAGSNDDNYPCLKTIVSTCKERSPPCSVRVYDNRSLATDACDLVSAQNLVLARSTLSDNLLLLGSQRNAIFGMLPCGNCTIDPFQYYELDDGNQVPNSKYYTHMCRFFDDAFVGYEVPRAYNKYNAIIQDSEWKSKLGQLMVESEVKRVACSR